MGSTGIVISDIVHFSNHPLYCDMYIYIYIYLYIYSESSVIRTSIIRILDYPNHKITLHVTHGLCNYHTNAHTQYIQSVHFQSHACFLCLKMAELLQK